MNRDEQPAVSIVITAHNEARSIKNCVLSLTKQSGIAYGGAEIIVVDDRSTDGTAEALADLVAENLRIIRLTEIGLPDLSARQNALDVGFRAARGSVILTIDADGDADPAWVSRMTQPLMEGVGDAIAGFVTFRPENNLLAGFQSVDAAFYLLFCRLAQRLGFAPGALFGSFAFRAEDYATLGGFESIGFSLTEDLSFVRKLHGNRRRIVFPREPAVSVAACPGWAALIIRAKRISAGGFSGLSMLLAIWIAMIPILGVLVLVYEDSILAACFLARLAAGVAVVQLATNYYTLRCRRSLILCYEIIVFVIALIVIFSVFWGRDVEWGGLRYKR